MAGSLDNSKRTNAILVPTLGDAIICWLHPWDA
jgi:hypothetical protein